jgi:DNA-binding NarL/FixJ family response regulator
MDTALTPPPPPARPPEPAPPPPAPPPPATVAIINDQPITRAGLHQLASTIPGLTVTAAVDHPDQLDPAPHTYDIVIIDIPPTDNGLTLTTITRIAQTSHTLAISTWDPPPPRLAGGRAGARAAVTRQSSHTTVTTALTTIAAGGLYLCPQLVPHFHHQLTHPPHTDPHGLAPREIETLQWIARGLTHTQIATRMGLSPATINTYAKRIRTKLNVNNKAELTRIAIENGHLPQIQPHGARGLSWASPS